VCVCVHSSALLARRLALILSLRFKRSSRDMGGADVVVAVVLTGLVDSLERIDDLRPLGRAERSKIEGSVSVCVCVCV
jgi:hypothetical protein